MPWGVMSSAFQRCWQSRRGFLPRWRGFIAVLDAQRDELFVASFERLHGEEPVATGTTRILRNENWLNGLESGSVVTGPGLSKLVPRLPAGIAAVSAELWAPTAASIGRVGWQLFCAGHRDDPFSLLPQYCRRTAAEEQWDRKDRSFKAAGQ